MHINTIKMFAHKTAADAVFGGKDTRVVIKSDLPGATVYIGYDGKFSASKKDDAFVYRYDTDKVSDQLLACAKNEMYVEVEAA